MRGSEGSPRRPARPRHPLVGPGAYGDRRAVGVELLEALGGSDDAGFVEAILEGLLEVEHRAVVGDLDLEGEGGGRPDGDRGVHGSSPSGVKAGRYRKYRV